MRTKLAITIPLVWTWLLLGDVSVAVAHCDTMNGPVVRAAEAALAKRDVTPVLKWVKPEHEADVRAVFQQALAVRGTSAAARELADRYLFETVVRLHRAGEGEPYTGLKPAGQDVSAAVEAADKALSDGSVEALVKLVTADVSRAIRQRYTEVTERQKFADTNVEAGREFVKAYVQYVHLVENLHATASARDTHHATTAGGESK